MCTRSRSHLLCAVPFPGAIKSMRPDTGVKVKDYAEVQVLADMAMWKISGLIKDGIDVDSKMPSFTYSKIEDAKLELLGKASQNAYERAVIIVSKTGGKIGPIRSASQGVFQIVAKNSTDVSDYGSYDVTTIEKTVKAVVTMDFDVVK